MTLGTGFCVGFLLRDWQIPPQESFSAASAWLRQTRIVRGVGQLLGSVAARLRNDARPPGLWSPLRAGAGSEAAEGIGWTGLTEQQREAVIRLRALGYAAGYEPAKDLANVTIHLAGLAYSGLNLYTSGHAPEAVLMDMQGNILHRWSYAFHDAFPDAHEVTWDSTGMDYWRRVHLYPNGDVLALYEGFGLVKLDKDSNLIWAASGAYHHDFFVDDAGSIYALSRQVQIVPRIDASAPLLLDFVTVLDADGNPVRRVPLLEAFEGSSYAPFLRQSAVYRDPEYGDLMHTNTIEVLDGSLEERSPAFRKGNVLVSILEMNVIAIVEMESESVVWALSGQWHRQHQPTLLDNGRILLFDNLGHGGMSKVIEIDPFTQRIHWSYESTPQAPFSSLVSGSNQRLANGNTLITESDTGRAFEVTPAGQIVWEFYNNARAGDDDELIAVLCEVVRLNQDSPMGWLDEMDPPAEAERPSR